MDPDAETVFQPAPELPTFEAEEFLRAACRHDSGLLKPSEKSPMRAQEAAGVDADGGTNPLGEQPGAMIGRYKLLERLGEGGMGTVWMAEQRDPLVRRVALKIIKLGMDTQEVIGRFEQERQALALMDHPCIARVFDAGATESGRPYFVMELVRGVALTSFCNEQKLGLPERLGLFMRICQAIQHAHQKGIIHRDLKPSNILVTSGDEDHPIPKVIDFGIAKATGRALTDQTLFTQLAQVIGTPAYMSPEQAGGGPQDIDTRSDIYSLGVLLYELLTGGPPLDPRELMSAGLDEMRRIIREKDPPRPSTRISVLAEEERAVLATRFRASSPRLVSQIRGDLDWIVMKAMDKNRSRRYASASEFTQDIQRHLENQPVLARPPGTAYLFSRFVQRHKFGFAAGTAVTLALVGGIAATTWGLQKAETARRFAESQTTLIAAEAHRATLANVENRKNLHLASVADLASALKTGTECFEAEQRGERPTGFAQKSRWCEVVALLARSLEREPENRRSALWLYEIMRHRPALSHDCPVQRFRHGNGVLNAAFSDDGRRLVTAGIDKTARVWDLATGQALGEPMMHQGPVASARFSPDGTRIVTACLDNTARVWDAAAGTALTPPMRHGTGQFAFLGGARFSPHGTRFLTVGREVVQVWDATTGQAIGEPARPGDGIWSVDFSPDGRTFVTGSNNKVARIWDAETGRAVGEPILHNNQVLSVMFNADGSRVLTAGETQDVQIRDVATGQPLIKAGPHKSTVTDARFSLDGTRLVTSSYDRTARLWDAATGKSIGTPLVHDERVVSARFSPDGTRVVTASEDRTARIWDAATGQPLSDPLRHTSKVLSADFNADGMKVLTVSEGGSARIWDVPTPRPSNLPLRHVIHVQSASFSRDGSKIVTAGQPARVWDATNGMVICELGTNEDYQAWNASFNKDGTRILTTFLEDRLPRLWDAANGNAIGEPLHHDDDVTSAWFSPDGTRIVTSSKDRTARIWEAATGKPAGDPMRHDDVVNSARFSPDGTQVITACADMTARVWNAQTGHAVGEPVRHAEGVESASFSPDGTRVVTSTHHDDFEDSTPDHVIHIWDVIPGKAVGKPISLSGELQSVVFSRDGRWLLTGTAGVNTAQVWDVETGLGVGKPMRHADSSQILLKSFSASFSPDGTRVVTACDDKIARVWDAATGNPLGDPMVHGDKVTSASFSPDGTRIVTTCDDGTARVWEVVDEAQSDAIAAVAPGVIAWAKNVAGLRFADDGELELVPEAERIAGITQPTLPSGPWADLSKWASTPAPQRAIDVRSPLSLRRIAEMERDFDDSFGRIGELLRPSRFQSGSSASLRSALQYDPTVPLARLLLDWKDHEEGVDLQRRGAFRLRFDLDALRREEGRMKSEELAELWIRAARYLVSQLPDRKIGIGPQPTTAGQEVLKAARTALSLAPENTSAREILKEAEANEEAFNKAMETLKRKGQLKEAERKEAPP